MLDLVEVEAALKRAAWNAVHGPPEVRAGRFVVRVGRSDEEKTRDAEKGESAPRAGSKQGAISRDGDVALSEGFHK
jgi:hypothetical protein